MREKRGQSPPLGDGIERRGVSDQPFDSHSIDLVALVEVNSSPSSPLKAGIEEPLEIFQGSPLGEGEFDVSLEGAGHADKAVGFPDGSAPLPCFRDVGLALRMTSRSLASVAVRQSPSSSMYVVISRDAFDLLLDAGFFITCSST